MRMAWLDAAELEALDETEPNYHRVRLDGGRYPTALPWGERLPACWAYVSKWGCLMGPDGRPRVPDRQRDLVADLLAQSKALRLLLGDTPETFVEQAAAHESKRDQARQIFREEGWVTGLGLGVWNLSPGDLPGVLRRAGRAAGRWTGRPR